MVKKKVTKKKSFAVGYKKLDPSKRAKKGEVRNPKGINISPERRALKELTVQSLSDAIKKVFTGTEKELKQMLNDSETSVGHKVILRAALDAAHNGNYSKFNEILERVIGKVPNKIEATSPDGSLTPKQVQFYLPSNNRDEDKNNGSN